MRILAATTALKFMRRIGELMYFTKDYVWLPSSKVKIDIHLSGKCSTPGHHYWISVQLAHHFVYAQLGWA
jgi:hypothetical protein